MISVSLWVALLRSSHTHQGYWVVPQCPPSLGTFPELIKPQGLCTLQDTFGLAGEGDSPGGIRIFGTQPWVGVRTLPAWMAG